MNGHVIKYYRWQYFMATMQHRVLAMTYWNDQEMMERRNTA